MLSGGPGGDRLGGGPDTDLIVGDAGRDAVNVKDRTRDYVLCGSGADRVTADKRDLVAPDCERVRRR